MTSALADHLRTLPDEDLGRLIRLRPDLVIPVPADLSALAGRAQSRTSVARALDQLDQFTLEVLDGLRLVRGSGPTASVEVLLPMATEAGGEPTQIRQAVQRLRERLLGFGEDAALRLVKAVDELGSPYPAGLGRPAAELDPEVAALVEDPARLRRTLLTAPPEARAVLDRLADGPPVGTISTGSLRDPARPAAPAAARATGTGLPGTGPPGTAATGTAASGAGITAPGTGTAAPNAGGTESPVRWLVAHRLLAVIADDAVELPREVGVLLRRETGPLGPVHPHPPEITAAPRPVDAVDSAGSGQALEAVRHLDALLAALAEADPRC